MSTNSLAFDATQIPLHIEKRLARIRQIYEEVLLIVSPPRCSSTALARVFWKNPSTAFYLHEPFDLTFHKQAGVEAALEALEDPDRISSSGTDLVIKEMTFQVGKHFPLLASLTRKPIIFLTRHPRLNIWSRIKKRQQGGQAPTYPAKESGWDDLAWQIEFCRQTQISYCVVDSTDFRNHPETVLQKLFRHLGMDFSSQLLQWQERNDREVGRLGGEQDHWYRRVLTSTTIQPATEAMPEIADFPPSMRDHVEVCEETYKMLSNDRQKISPTP